MASPPGIAPRAAVVAPRAVSVLGGPWDLLLLGPGATLAVSGLLFGLMKVGLAGAASVLTALLSVMAVGPHYAATYRRAYASAEIVRAHPLVTLVAPPLLLIASLVAVRSRSIFGPLYFLTYVVWAGYHYSGQSLGLAMVFPLRQGARLDRREKRLLAAPLYCSWLLSVLGVFRVGVPGRNEAYEIVRDSFGVALPGWVLPAALAALLASLGCVAVVARDRRARGVPLPLASYGVIAAQTLWFAGGLFSPMFNLVLVPIFHGIQYLALTSWHHLRASGPATPRKLAAYLGGVIVLGLAINPGLQGVVKLFGPSAGYEAVAGIAAAVSAINLHHFLLDGRIWRMREPRVQQALGG